MYAFTSASRLGTCSGACVRSGAGLFTTNRWGSSKSMRSGGSSLMSDVFTSSLVASPTRCHGWACCYSLMPHGHAGEGGADRLQPVLRDLTAAELQRREFGEPGERLRIRVGEVVAAEG